MAFRIRRNVPLGDEFRRILGEEIDCARADIHDLNRDPKYAVHQFRKRCKRLRALLALFRSSLGSTGRREARRIRDCARQLAEVRTLHALHEISDQFDLGPLTPPAGTGESDLSAIAASIEAEWSQLEKAFTGGFGVQFDRSAMANDLTRIHRRSREAWRRARRQPDPANLHEWRKAAKRYWYAVRLTQPLADRSTRRIRSRLARTCELLGHHHDLSILDQVLAMRPADSIPPTDVTLPTREHSQKIERKVISLGSRIHAKRSRRFARRLLRRA